MAGLDAFNILRKLRTETSILARTCTHQNETGTIKRKRKTKKDGWWKSFITWAGGTISALQSSWSEKNFSVEFWKSSIGAWNLLNSITVYLARNARLSSKHNFTCLNTYITVSPEKGMYFILQNAIKFL